MKRKIATQKITLTGMLIGLGLLLPYVTAHAFGMQGTVFLPMHYSVFMVGFLCDPLCGAIAGLATPLLSSLLTGMPAFFPMLPVMMCELFVYGWLTAVLYHKKINSIYGTLIISMFAGRMVHGVVFALLMLTKEAPVTFASAAVFVVEGLPGTIMQLLILPPVIHLLEKTAAVRTGEGNVAKLQEIKNQKLLDVIGEAKGMIKENICSFVVIKEGKIVYQDKGNGVKPIIKLLDTDRELLKDAVVVDKIIGKAAALLLCLGQVKMIYGITMSETGKKYLDSIGMDYKNDMCIDVISNRKRDGICPLERAVNDIDEPEAAYHKLKETIKELMKSAV